MAPSCGSTDTTAARMSGSCPSRYFDTAFSAACWALGSMVVVTCRPCVFSVRSSMLKSSISSLVT
ncbi:hypothetical protein PICSAR65_04586 [Mycobacterium avium subsp. paratuberculosis]|nr:hypothetical protein PICSAR65_04586 [Mycobacterium avium subsp. paratuberculosis]